jgi:uracil-DNA glycosylase
LPSKGTTERSGIAETMTGPVEPRPADASVELPGEGASAELTPAAELAELARLLRAELEWQRMTGAIALPHGELPSDAPAVSAAPDAPRPETPRPETPRSETPRSETPRSETPRSETPSLSRDSGSSRLPLPPQTGLPKVAESVSPVDSAERQHRLTMLETTVRTCTACALHRERTQAVFARGTGSSGLCFIGEGPGADEDAQGYPFVGPAGQLLDRMIAAMGLEREEVYVCNIVKCRPPKNRKPEPDEMRTCSPYLIEQIELVAPRVIVALGATAVQGLLGTTEGITRLRGTWKLYQGRIPVMPTFHPAFLLRTPSAKREVWTDLQAVLQQMGRQVPVPPRPSR